MLHALSRHRMLLSDNRYINLLILLWATVRKESDLLKFLEKVQRMVTEIMQNQNYYHKSDRSPLEA